MKLFFDAQILSFKYVEFYVQNHHKDVKEKLTPLSMFFKISWEIQKKVNVIEIAWIRLKVAIKFKKFS